MLMPSLCHPSRLCAGVGACAAARWAEQGLHASVALQDIAAACVSQPCSCPAAPSQTTSGASPSWPRRPRCRACAAVLLLLLCRCAGVCASLCMCRTAIHTCLALHPRNAQELQPAEVDVYCSCAMPGGCPAPLPHGVLSSCAQPAQLGCACFRDPRMLATLTRAFPHRSATSPQCLLATMQRTRTRRWQSVTGAARGSTPSEQAPATVDAAAAATAMRRCGEVSRCSAGQGVIACAPGPHLVRPAPSTGAATRRWRR